MWDIPSRIVCERVLCVWKNCVPLSCVRWQPNSQRHQSWCPYCWIWSKQKKKEEPKKNVASQTSWFFLGSAAGAAALNIYVYLSIYLSITNASSAARPNKRAWWHVASRVTARVGSPTWKMGFCSCSPAKAEASKLFPTPTESYWPQSTTTGTPCGEKDGLPWERFDDGKVLEFVADLNREGVGRINRQDCMETQQHHKKM